MNIALVGDFNEEVVAHKAIPLAIELAGVPGISYEWIHSDDVEINTLQKFSAVWCVPASPYSNMENVLAAINYARINNVPFLGTCGGYQHAALEYARNALGYTEADNAEVNPETSMPLISALSCKLYDVKNSIKLAPDSFVHSLYAAEVISEEYFCGYGVNPEYLSLFDGSELRFSGHDHDGDPRVLEIKENHFFVGTAFQPERSALSGHAHPLIQAFVKCIENTQKGGDRI